MVDRIPNVPGDQSPEPVAPPPQEPVGEMGDGPGLDTLVDAPADDADTDWTDQVAQAEQEIKPRRARGVRVAQARTGTATDAPDPLAVLRAMGASERIDDNYAKTLDRREKENASRWFSQFNPETAQDPAQAQQAIPGVANPLALPGVLRYAMPVAKDVGKGLALEAHKTTLGAALKDAAAALDGLDQIATWLSQNAYGDPNAKPAGLKDAVPNIGGSMDDPQTVTGNVIQGINRFLLGYAGAGKITKLGNGLVGATTKGAISDFSVFGGAEENLANILQMVPALQNPVSEYLADKTNNSELEGRLKNAVTGVVGATLMQPIVWGLQALRAARHAKELTGSQTYEEAADKLARGGVGPGEGATQPIGSRMEQLLGRESDPLVTQIQGQLKPIDYGVHDSTAAKSLADVKGAYHAPDIQPGMKRTYAISENVDTRPGDFKPPLGFAHEATEDLGKVKKDMEWLGDTGNYKIYYWDVPVTEQPAPNGNYPIKVPHPGGEFFTTADGVTYQVHPNGSTSRGQTDFEAMGRPKSTKTFYVSPEDAEALKANPEPLVNAAKGKDQAHPVAEDGSRIYQEPVTIDAVVDHNGKKFAKFEDPENGAIKFWPIEQMQRDGVKASVAPRQGLIPAEVWDNGGVRFGEPISEVKSVAADPAPGQIPKTFSNEVPANWARIDSPDDVKAVLGAMMDAQAAEIKAAQRGVRSNKVTEQAAGDENAWQGLFGQRVGALPPAEMQLAMRKLWAASGQKLMEVAKAAEVGGLEDLYAFRRMMAVHNTIQQVVLGMRTETARALQQWRIPAGGDAEKMAQLQAVLTTNGGGENVSRALAQRIAVLADNPEWAGAIEEIARKGALAKTADAVREIWVNAILSGPKTHIVNMMSNSAVVAQAIAERAIAGRLGDVLHPVEGVKVGEALAMWWGVKQSLKDAFVYAARSARTGETGHWNASKPGGEPGFDLGKLEGQRTRAISSEALEMPDSMMAKGVDMLGAGVSAPGRMLGAEDEFFKTINYRAELWAQAFRQTSEDVERGLLPREQLKQRVADLVADPPENLRMKAADFAFYNTFNNEAGPVAQQIMKLRDTIPLGYMVMPFIRTPANIFKFAFERTPLAPVIARFREDVAAGGARQDLALAKLGLGTAVATVALDMALDGHFTGSGPDGDKGSAKRALLKRSGWQPYSIRVPTGETEDGKPIYRYYAYNRMDPIGLQIGFAAELAEYLRNKDGPRVDAQAEEIFAATAASAAQNMMDKAYVRGFSDLIDALHNPERKGESYFGRIISSFVPTGVKEVAGYMDPVARQVTDWTSALKARTPGLSKDLPPRKDFWGNDVTYSSGLGAGYDAFSPIYSKSTEKAQPIDREFYALNYAPIHPGNLSVEGKSISLRNMPEAKNRFIELSAATPASQLIKENEDGLVTKKGRTSAVVKHLEEYGDKTMQEYLNSLVQGGEGQKSLDYKAADADEKVKLLKDVMRNYHQAAKVQVIREFPRIKTLRADIPGRDYDEGEAPF